MSEATKRVKVDVYGGVATLTLTRPDKHNGVDRAMLAGVLDAQSALKKRRDVRALILRGEGPSFCAGIDAKSVLAGNANIAWAFAQLVSPRRNAFQAWSMGFRELGFPVIASIHGNCFGAGIQLALGADVRIARPDSKLSVMEARLGLVPDMGGPTLLRELVRIDVAKELTMTGRIVSGRDAHAIGLVTHINDDPYAHAKQLAAEIAARSPDAVAAGKFLLQRAWGADEARALAHERRYQLRIIGRENQRLAQSSGAKERNAADAISWTPRRIES